MNTFLKRTGFWLFLLSGGWWVHGFDPETDGMTGIMDLVRKRFPEVHQLSTEELALWLNDTHRARPVILDVRLPEEYEVSHLAGAQQVDPKIPLPELRSKIATNRPVVVYCSVGYRSSALAERLMQAGVTNVFNLEGSIFKWANEGRPLRRQETNAHTVHPYNIRYGVLLKPELRDTDSK